MEPRQYLRVEGLAILGCALAIYFWLGGSVWMLLVFGLAPDLAMLGYLAGPRIGSHTYNIVHTYTLPLALVGAGLWMDVQVLVLIAAIWVGHIGADRLLGYGLKFESGFKDTHLSTQSAPVAVLDQSE